MDQRSTLAENLRVLRAKQNLNIKDAASKIGITRETLRDLENGTRDPYPPTLARIATGYNISVRDMLSPAEELITEGKAEASSESTSPKETTEAGPTNEHDPLPPSSPEPEKVSEEERRERFRRWRETILEEGLAWEGEIEAVANGKQPIPGPRWAGTLQLAAIGLMDALEEQGVHEALGPVLDAIDEGQPVPEDLRREATLLWNALVVLLDVGNKAYAAARKARELGGSSVEVSEIGKRAERQRRRKTEDTYNRHLEAVS